MKKIFLLLTTLFIFSSLFSQNLTESFNGSTFPPMGWQNLQITGTGLWERVTAGIDPVCVPHSGSGMAHFNSYNFSVGTNALLVSPSQNFNGTEPHKLSFWMYADAGWLIYPDSLGVYYNTTASLSGAIHLETIQRYNPEDGWYKHSYLLPASLNGSYYILFRGYSQYGNNMFIDDVSLAVPPTEDVAALSFLNDTYLTSGTVYNPQSEIKNMGLNTISGTVTFEGHDFSNNQIYTSTKAFTNLASWNDTIITFDPVTLPNAEAIYYARVYTTLAGDLDHSNDTIEKTFYTYTHSRHNVMLEVATGTWCQFCPGAALGADDLVTNGKHVAVVENHNGDNYAYAASDARNTYYAVTGYPTAVFDGIKKLTGGDHTVSLYTSYLPIYDNRYAIKTAFGITIAGTAVGNNYNLNILVERYGESPFATSNLVLHMALTQSHIQYNWQGQSHLEYVSRLMAPDANGSSIDLSTATQVNVPLSFTFNTAWGGSIANHDFEIVAWVQDLTTKEITDAQKYDLADITVGINNPDPVNPITAITPNPAKNSTSVQFYLLREEQTSLLIYDMTGKLVKTLTQSKYTNGQHKVDWDLTNEEGTKVCSGLYLLKLKAGSSISSARIIVTD